MHVRCGKIAALATLVVASISASGEELELGEGFLEDVALQVSLLQSSLTVARADRADLGRADLADGAGSLGRGSETEEANEPPRSSLLFAPVSGIQPSWLWQIEGLSIYGRAAKASMSRHLSLVLQMTLPTDRTAVSGLPALVVFMVAALVMVLFVSQMIGVFFEEKVKEEPPGYFSGEGYLKPRWPMDYPGDGQERSTLGRTSLPPMTLPHTPGNPPGIPGGIPGGNPAVPGSSQSAPSAVSTLPMLDRWSGRSEPARSSSLTGTLPEASDRAALIPRLIQPSSEAQFHVPVDGLSSLWRGESPVGIYGPGGHTLLFARFSQDSKDRRWLELSTTANTQFPHCRVGPLRLGADPSGACLHIFGPNGDKYGLLQNCGEEWQLRRAEGSVLMSVGAAAGGVGLTAATDGQLTATAWPEHAGALVVKVSPGRDPLLALLCMLAVLLLSPELSGLGH